MADDLPAQRSQEPRLTRVRVGERDEKRGMKDRKSFDLARPAASVDANAAPDAPHVVDGPLMQRLFEALRLRELRETQKRINAIREAMDFTEDAAAQEQQEAEIAALRERAQKVMNAAYNAAKFAPRIIPIELSKPHWRDHLSLDMGRWRKSGPECVATGFRPLKPSELARDDVQAALRAQGLPTQPTAKDIASNAEYSCGQCTRTLYGEVEVKGKKLVRRLGTEDGVCLPLLCPHFRSADPKTHAPCKPHIVFTFRLPWTAERGYAYFTSTSWHTASELKATLEDVWRNCGESLVGVRLLFVTYPKSINTPAGKQTKPICYVVPDSVTFEELRQQALGLGPSAQAAAKALPAPAAIGAHPTYAPQTMSEFVPEAPGELPSWESDFYARANAAGMTDAWIAATLQEAGDVPDTAEALLEAAARAADRPATEQPVAVNGQGALL